MSVCKINKEKNSDLLQLCEPLRAYSEVVFRVRRNKERGLNDVTAELTEKLTSEITEKMEIKYKSELDNLQKELNMLKTELLKRENQ